MIVLAALIAIVAADVSELSADSQITTLLGKDGYEYPVPETRVDVEEPTEAAPVAVVDEVEEVAEPEDVEVVAETVEEDPSQEYLPPVEYLPPNQL